MAYDEERDKDLVSIDCSHLFPSSTTYLGIRKESFLRGYTYGFIELLSPKFDRKAVDRELKG
jgi:LysR family cys regulon transcriptional activator